MERLASASQAELEQVIGTLKAAVNDMARAA